MKTTEYDESQLVEQAASMIREEAEALDPQVESAAMARVWEGLSTTLEENMKDTEHRILDCNSLQDLLPAYHAGDLKPDRALLVEDHARTCIPCRRALKGSSATFKPSNTETTTGGGVKRWAWAAVLLLGLGVAPWLYFQGGNDGSFHLVSGTLYAPGGETVSEIALGDEVSYGSEVVTPRGETAVLELSDGSRVELRERSRLRVAERRGSTTIELSAGNIVVEAAKQKQGRLYVATEDCLVAVKGTVFSVNHGTRGSRVAVFEGEVEVNEGGRDHTLNPGDQISTRPSLGMVSLSEEIAWSGSAEEYLALLQELSDLSSEIKALPQPGLRYSSSLIDLLPAQTAVYVALPNFSSSIGEAIELFESRLQNSGVLADWAGSSEPLDQVREALDHVLPLGENLGEELVVTGWWQGEEFVGPALLAETGDSASLREDLEAELAAIADGELVLVDDPYGAGLPEDGLLIWVSEEGVIAAPGADALRQLADSAMGASESFTGQPFQQRIAARYQNGVDLILAADLQQWSARAEGEEIQHFAALGFDGAEDLIVEQRTEGEQVHRQAILSFSEERHGVASWLAEPSTMLSLSFMSPDTTTVAAALVKDPSALFADILAVLTTEEAAEVEAHLEDFVAEHGWDPRDDFLAALGGEVAVALDGPLAPVPSWKVVIEVYDSGRLQQGIESFIADANDRLAAEGKPTIGLTETPDGWLVTGTEEEGTQHQAYYGFIDGYLVVTPTAALLDRADRFHEASFNLLSSDRLSALLPADGQMNYSAIWYQDFSSLLEPLGGLLAGGGLGEALPPEVQEGLASLGEDIGPSVVYAIGDDDEITLAATSQRNPLGLVQLLAVRDLIGSL